MRPVAFRPCLAAGLALAENSVYMTRRGFLGSLEKIPHFLILGVTQLTQSRERKRAAAAAAEEKTLAYARGSVRVFFAPGDPISISTA